MKCGYYASGSLKTCCKHFASEEVTHSNRVSSKTWWRCLLRNLTADGCAPPHLCMGGCSSWVRAQGGPKCRFASSLRPSRWGNNPCPSPVFAVRAQPHVFHFQTRGGTPLRPELTFTATAAWGEAHTGKSPVHHWYCKTRPCRSGDRPRTPPAGRRGTGRRVLSMANGQEIIDRDLQCG